MSSAPSPTASHPSSRQRTSTASRSSKTTPITEPTYWYKEAVIYQAHVKAFADSNADGIGDFAGLMSRLDYLQSLGITALWLLPFYPSPQRDDGYDIADYYDVHPNYGTLADFRAFLKEAHRRGLRVITELVINHTSDEHPWFQRARRARKGSVERDYYVWSDTAEEYKEARIIFRDFEPSNWTWDPVANAYFWHRFYHHQPDLNFDNPAVRKSIFKMLDFWLEMGVDGLRLDAIPYLFEREGTNCENLDETHAYLKELRAHVDRHFPDAMLLAEACQWPEDVVAYFGDGDSCHMAFHFPVMPRMFMALQMEDRYPIIDILEQTPAIPETCQWAIFLRNHDELTLEMVTDEERDYMYRAYANDARARINLGIRRRLAPLLGNNRRKIELINILLFSLPGTPIIYYGDEIGMGDNIYLGDRNGVRTPMQWSPDRNAGFSRANPQQLYLPIIIDPEYHYESICVENQERNLSSLLYWMRRVIAMRKRYAAFGRGTTQFLQTENPKTLAFIRQHGDETILVVVNLARFAQAVELDLSAFAGRTPRELFSQNRFPIIKSGVPYTLTLGPHGHYWLRLEAQITPTAPRADRGIHTLQNIDGWGALFSTAGRRKLESNVLPDYLPACRWFRSKTRTIQSLAIAHALPVADASDAAHLLWINVSYVEGAPETYLLPLQIAFGDAAERVRATAPHSVVATLGRNGDEAAATGVLFDATFDEGFRTSLLRLVAGKKRLRAGGAGGGEIAGVPSRELRILLGTDGTEPVASHVLGAEQTNTSIVYDGKVFLKFYRKAEEGENPDIELTRFLSERCGFAHTPPFAGLIEYRPGEGKSSQVVALLQGAVAAERDAWTLTVEAATRYLERTHAGLPELPPAGVLSARLSENDLDSAPANVQALIGGIYPERAELLGRRTGEMHVALASERREPAFAPEPFTMLYQRSLLQSLTGQARRVFASLRRSLPSLDEARRVEASAILERMGEVNALWDRALRGRPRAAVKTRVHGDYHLGQVLFTGKDFAIIDFEGEPAKPLGERKLKRCPLVDVAGMLRSFHYAVSSALLQKLTLGPAEAVAVGPWAELWYGFVAGSFLRGYLRAVAGSDLVPPDAETFEALVRVFLLDKAIYEVGYELNNRPAWLGIPLRGITQCLDQAAAVETSASSARK